MNVVQPGYIDTPGERAYASDAELEASAAAIPWQRLGHPSDIAAAVAFLVSDAAEYVTGDVMSVDGGSRTALAVPGVAQIQQDGTVLAKAKQ